MRAETQLLVQPVRDAGTLDALRPEWEQLWRACRGPVFCAPSWLRPWWGTVGQGTLAGIALRAPADGLLVGFAPLYVHVEPASALRQLLPLGVATSDRLDLLLRPGWEPAAGAALVAALARPTPAWDRLELPQHAPEAAAARLPWPAHWQLATSGEPAPVLPLPAAVPRPMAQALAYARRRATREAAAAVLQARGIEEASALLDALEALHAARWSRRGEAGVLRAGGVLPWLRAALPGLLHDGLLRLLGLRLHGRIAAVLLALADPPGWPQRRWSYWIGGFDPALAALSPGTLLVGAAIDAATAEGCAAFDFLRGDEPYKRRWGAVPQRLAGLRVTRRAGDASRPGPA